MASDSSNRCRGGICLHIKLLASTHFDHPISESLDSSATGNMKYTISSTILTLVFALVFCAESLAQEQTFRTWTSANGKHTFEAKLISEQDGKVGLEGKDGKTLTLELAKLSDDDQAFISKAAVGTATDADDEEGTSAGGSSAGGGKITKDQKEKLKEMGLKLSREEFSFLDEKKLKSDISKSLKNKRELIGLSIELENVRVEQLQRESQIVNLKQLNINLNAQLVNASSVKENNKIVGELNANMSAIELIEKEIANLENNHTQGLVFINQEREKFVAEVLKVREFSDSLDERMKTIAEDESFKKLLTEIETTTKKKTKPFKETKSLARLRGNLEKLESGVLSESIPLRDDGSGTFLATVTINGQSPVELCVDSGASLISLPQTLAQELNIVPGPDAKDIRLTIANGDIIEAKLVLLESVRVGKFTVNNVECAVLEESATNASGLLGMSFLGNYKWELDSAKAELKLMSVETEE